MKKIINILLLISLLSLSLTSCASTGVEDSTDPNVWFYNSKARDLTMSASSVNAVSATSKVLGASSDSSLYIAVPISNNEDFSFLRDALSSRDDIKVYLNLKLEDDVHTIPKNAFENCKSLAYLIVNGPLYTIGEKAFTGCTFLNTVILPNTVSYIDSSAFLKCLSLNGLIVGEENEPLLKDKDYFVDYLTVSEACDLIGNKTSGTLALSIFIEDEIDVYTLVNELELVPSSVEFKLDLALASDISTFNKSQFNKFRNVEIIAIFGNAVIR